MKTIEEVENKTLEIDSYNNQVKEIKGEEEKITTYDTIDSITYRQSKTGKNHNFGEINLKVSKEFKREGEKPRKEYFYFSMDCVQNPEAVVNSIKKDIYKEKAA